MRHVCVDVPCALTSIGCRAGKNSRRRQSSVVSSFARFVDNHPLSRTPRHARARHPSRAAHRERDAPTPERIAARTHATVSARATPARADANANAEAAANAHDVVARRPVRPRADDAGGNGGDDDDASHARSRVAIIDAIGARVGVWRQNVTRHRRASFRRGSAPQSRPRSPLAVCARRRRRRRRRRRHRRGLRARRGRRRVGDARRWTSLSP